MKLAPLIAALLVLWSPVASPVVSSIRSSPGGAAAGPVAPIRAGAFVRVEGTRFFVGDRPFFFLGANLDPLHGEDNRRRYREILHALAGDGLTVGRVWAVGEGQQDAGDYSRKFELFRAGPAGFIEESYRQLDRVLFAARQEGVRLIITLSNHWADYGGVPAYLRWAGLPTDGMAYERFYEDQQTRAFFRAGLLHLLTRKNTLTGVRYIDDPTIFSWELMNESVVLTDSGAAARRRWIAEMAAFIKRRDPHHLVSAGLLGYAMRKERAEWIAVQQMKEVDYCDSHLYPQSSGQIGTTGTTTAADALRRLRDFLDDRAQLAAHVIGKPLIFGEFGFRTDGPADWLGVPRAAWFGRFLDRLIDNGSAGALVWIYQPFADKPRDFGIYIDRPDTDDVRAAIRARAPRFSAGLVAKNPRLSAARGDGLLYDPLLTLTGPPGARSDWSRTAQGDPLLLLPPGAFSLARFERAGVWDGGALFHAYGADAGSFTYRFRAPPASWLAGTQEGETRAPSPPGPRNPPGPPSPPGPRTPARVVIEARLSSEWPGTSAPADGGSVVQVWLDGRQVRTLAVIPDDGLGRQERIVVDDPALLAALSRGTHSLTFEVPYSPAAHGLCIYGAATGKEAVPPGDYAAIRVRYLGPSADDRNVAEGPAPGP